MDVVDIACKIILITFFADGTGQAKNRHVDGTLFSAQLSQSFKRENALVQMDVLHLART